MAHRTSCRRRSSLALGMTVEMPGLTGPGPVPIFRAASEFPRPAPGFLFGTRTMKIRSSLKTIKSRHKACRVVRRKGRVYVINKTNPRFKARAG